jgi:hypothetical protein
MPRSLEAVLLEACVGKGPVKEWTEWVSKADLPTPVDMLTKGWTPDPTRLDTMMASLVSMVRWVADMAPGKDTKKLELQHKYAIAAWAIIGSVIDIKKKDIVLRPASILVTAELGHNCPNTVVAEAARVVLGQLKGFAAYRQVA